MTEAEAKKLIAGLTPEERKKLHDFLLELTRPKITNVCDFRFRNPKTGETFDDIESAVRRFQCPGPCNPDCPLAEKTHGARWCLKGGWWRDHPVEAARLIGLELIPKGGPENEV